MRRGRTGEPWGEPQERPEARALSRVLTRTEPYSSPVVQAQGRRQNPRVRREKSEPGYVGCSCHLRSVTWGTLRSLLGSLGNLTR